MGKSLKDIAQELREKKKKVQLIYAFNGTGKTRLSREFKELVSPKQEDAEEDDKVIYYNAFTEDLFYWDNDLEGDTNRILKIRSNSFTPWVLADRAQDSNINTNFQRYTNTKLTPHFNPEYTTKTKEGKDIIVSANSEITFSINAGNENENNNIKISKGEESCFIWCIFYFLITEIVDILNPSQNEEKDEEKPERFTNLEYIFIDDPVSSLDENHLIELAVNIAELITSCKSNLKFIITTHNPLFYNVLYNELNLGRNKEGKGIPCTYILRKNEDGTFELEEKIGDSNKSFSYHFFLIKTICDAKKSNNIQRYHYTLLRNIYEKTANFLGYKDWRDLLPDNRKVYYKRIINFTSHSKLSNETVAEPTPQEKETVFFLLKHIVKEYYSPKIQEWYNIAQ